MRKRIFLTPFRLGPALTIADAIILLVIAVVLYLGTRLAFNTPAEINGPDISLSAAALPYYALLSLGRMLAAYLLSLGFSIAYGYNAARNPGLARWLMPLLDVLQSVPILSFLPVVLLSLTAILPQGVAVELAAIVLIFTSQVWNLTFSFYQSMRTIPMEYREAAAIFRFSRWLRMREVELPFAATGLIWNSIMSWAGGWFFLMAAEIFTLGDRDFRLPGLGAYLQTAAIAGDQQALLLGLVTLVLIIILLDQLIWRPLLVWAERFKVSQVETDNPATSWFYDQIHRSGLAQLFTRRVVSPLSRWLDVRASRAPSHIPPLEDDTAPPISWLGRVLFVVFGLVIAYGAWQALLLLLTLPLAAWGEILVGALATLLRVSVAVAAALAWTVPVGVLIGTNARAAAVLQPVAQIAASVPATALFPILLVGLLAAPGGPDAAAVLLMLLGTQWYLLFNIIAGASSIPQDLQFTSDLMQLHGWKRWRTLILPALFPYIITGLITASGGAWNASIVAEYTHFGDRVTHVTGLGALITQSTATGDYALLLASTLTMILLVVLINRFVWRRLYRTAETRFRMDQ
jgi:NitT/TauT family transport system permease protein